MKSWKTLAAAGVLTLSVSGAVFADTNQSTPTGEANPSGVARVDQNKPRLEAWMARVKMTEDQKLRFRTVLSSTETQALKIYGAGGTHEQAMEKLRPLWDKEAADIKAILTPAQYKHLQAEEAKQRKRWKRNY